MRKPQRMLICTLKSVNTHLHDLPDFKQLTKTLKPTWPGLTDLQALDFEEVDPEYKIKFKMNSKIKPKNKTLDI